MRDQLQMNVLPVNPMPDPMAKWSPVPDWGQSVIIGNGWSARPISGLGRTIVIGKTAQAIEALAYWAPIVSLWQVVDAQIFAIQIGRDKALIVSPAPLAIESGWNSAGWAATPADSAYLAIELAGEGLADVLSEATTTDLDAGSRSAAILFAGVPALLVRRAPQVAVLHVEMARAAYVWRWLETRL